MCLLLLKLPIGKTAHLGYSKEFFNDTTVPINKAKHYALSRDVKNVNTQKGRTKEDLRAKGEILL